MVFYIAVVVLILTTGITLLGVQLYFRSLTDAELKKRTPPDLLEKLIPYGSTCYDETVWKAIGGTPGVKEIRRSMHAMCVRSARIALEEPMVAADATRMLVRGILGFCLSIRALVEAWMCNLYPGTPRIYACALARLYVEMAATMDALDSIHSYVELEIS